MHAGREPSGDQGTLDGGKGIWPEHDGRPGVVMARVRKSRWPDGRKWEWRLAFGPCVGLREHMTPPIALFSQVDIPSLPLMASACLPSAFK